MKNTHRLFVFIFLIVFLLSSCKMNKSDVDVKTTQTVIPILSESPSPIISLKPTPSPTPKPTIIEKASINDLYKYLQRYLATYSGDYGMYFYNLETKEGFGIRDKEKYIAASTSKIPVNLYLYKLVAEGKINLDTKVKYLEEDKEYGSGKIIKEPYGSEYTLKELSKFSIELSDNCAINMIIRTVGKENFINYMNNLGAVIDYHTYRSSPYDMYLYLKELYKLNIENSDVYGDMLSYLKNTIYNDRIPKLLPKDIEIAHKIGDYLDIPSYNDVGIVYAKQPYIISLMCNEINIDEAYEIMQNTSKIVYDYITYGNVPIYEIDNTKLIPEKIIKSARPYTINFYDDVIVDEAVVKYYFDQDDILFGDSSEYGKDLGVITFRGNNYRDGGAFGSANIVEEKLEIIWDFDIGIIKTQSGGIWPGVGWTGQPSIVKWDDAVLDTMNVYSQFKHSNLKEVIYATLDGNIYFCDLETGQWTREPINMGYPTKGSVSIDERGYPLLYTGQGIDENGTEQLSPKYRIYNLTNQSLAYKIEGNDSFAFRKWFAFDSSGLLDAKNDTFYELGENGLIYKIKLNTTYDVSKGTITIEPTISKYRYKNPFGNRYGFESSPVIYEHYLYATDNSGLLVCIDLNTFKTMWYAFLGDDSDSTPVLEVTDKGVYIYTATEVDRQGDKENEDDQYYPSYIRKFNALTGEIIWEKQYMCYFNSIINGGVLSTPVLGKNELSNMVIYSIAKTGSKGGGRLVALDKNTGEEIWAKEFNAYSWSSPTAIYTKEGKGYLLYCTFYGQMHLIDGQTGEIKDTISLGDNIEGTPAVYNNIAVVGSYAQKIFGIKIK